MKNRKKFLIWLLFFVTIFLNVMGIYTLVELNSTDSNIVRKQAIKGAINVGEDILEQKKLIMLNGEWEFYPNNFYYPKDFIHNQGENKILLQFPGSWEGMKYHNKTLNSNGYGTYRLIIKSEMLSKEVGMLFSSAPAEAYRVYVNGEEAFSVGNPGTNKENTIQEYKTQLYHF
ncbi:hypothetical protein [Marinisporobacter balticus]|uniref:Uncharacterized protein n=1 Tax=Marinisporobacter balticus TaxID=2018667 RepID=A0A4R2KGU0_9FIRM|nr:hypothetical protein [Marinisporobacter balticus]TCO69669.1 hypothetical protein EV214_1304 [Marinisporobacter balticus]